MEGFSVSAGNDVWASLGRPWAPQRPRRGLDISDRRRLRARPWASIRSVVCIAVGCVAAVAVERYNFQPACVIRSATDDPMTAFLCHKLPLPSTPGFLVACVAHAAAMGGLAYASRTDRYQPHFLLACAGSLIATCVAVGIETMVDVLPLALLITLVASASVHAVADVFRSEPWDVFGHDTKSGHDVESRIPLSAPPKPDPERGASLVGV